MAISSLSCPAVTSVNISPSSLVQVMEGGGFPVAEQARTTREVETAVTLPSRPGSRSIRGGTGQQTVSQFMRVNKKDRKQLNLSNWRENLGKERIFAGLPNFTKFQS